MEKREPLKDAGVLIVVSEQLAAIRRIRQVCRELGLCDPLFLSDSVQLAQMLTSAPTLAGSNLPSDQTSDTPEQIIGVVLDLSAPLLCVPHEDDSATSDDATKSRLELEISRAIAALLAAVYHRPDLPLFVVSPLPILDDILRQSGLPRVQQLDPRAPNTTWQQTLAPSCALPPQLAEASATSIAMSSPSAGAAALPASAVRLSTQVWLDTDAWTLNREGRDEATADATIPLTRLERDLLRIFLAAPRCFHTASVLAQRLTRPSGYEMDPRAVAQALYGLRRKLGKIDCPPDLLVTRWGQGYALYPDTSAVPAGAVPAAVLV